MENVRVVLTDGASHAVDSSELAFKLAALYAFRQVTTHILLHLCYLELYHIHLSGLINQSIQLN